MVFALSVSVLENRGQMHALVRADAHGVLVLSGIILAIQELAAQKRLTHVELAAMMNCTDGYLRKVLHGEVAVTRLMVESLLHRFPELDGNRWRAMALLDKTGGYDLPRYLAEIPAERHGDALHLLEQLMKLRRA